MNFTFSEEQLLIRDAAERYFREAGGPEIRRRHQALIGGFCPETWAAFADMGWLALGIPEVFGGIGGGGVETAILMEAMGRGLSVQPYLATVGLAAWAVSHGAPPDLAAAVLPRVAAGELILSFAHLEPGMRHDLDRVACRAVADGGAFRLTGEKVLAPFGGQAVMTVVAARTAGAPGETQGLTLFLIDVDAPGLTLRDHATVDDLRAATLVLDDVPVPAERILGEVDDGHGLLSAAVDRGAALLAAEATGLMAALVDGTVGYLKQRRQFDRPLSAFQALQHRLTEMYLETELTRSLVYMAAVRIDGDDPQAAARAVAQAKAKTGQAGRLVGQEAVQLHGGMGVTDEMAVGHYFKRLTMIDQALGDRAHHLERLAAAPD